jgi:hypothetical protein
LFTAPAASNEYLTQGDFAVGQSASFCCCRTVSRPAELTRLGNRVERKQIPQVVENIESRRNGMEPLEEECLRPRQVRYQAALRPDSEEMLMLLPFPTHVPPPRVIGA